MRVRGCARPARVDILNRNEEIQRAESLRRRAEVAESLKSQRKWVFAARKNQSGLWLVLCI
jgi:hypothetical protein